MRNTLNQFNNDDVNDDDVNDDDVMMMTLIK